MVDEQQRVASLKRQSDDHLMLALQKVADGLTSDAARDAYHAGYCALVAALLVEELQQFQDHPSAVAADRAAERLGVDLQDRRLAAEGATAFYGAGSEAFAVRADWYAWATRLRHAAGWSL